MLFKQRQGRHGFRRKSHVCCIRDQARKSAARTVKMSKIQPWENFGHKLDPTTGKPGKCSNIPTTGKPTKCSGKQPGHFMANDFILLDPSKTKIVSRSSIRRTSLEDGERNSKIFQNPSIPHYQTHRRYIWGSDRSHDQEVRQERVHNYRNIFQLSLPGKLCAKYPAKRGREIS